MNKKYSTSWKSSKQPRKQRKYRANAPLHTRRKFMKSKLSKELKEKHKKRSITVRKEDTVKIVTGSYRGKTGKVTKVDYTKLKVLVDGASRVKKDGTRIPYPIDPSNIIITQMNTSDKKRLRSK